MTISRKNMQKLTGTLKVQDTLCKSVSGITSSITSMQAMKDKSNSYLLALMRKLRFTSLHLSSTCSQVLSKLGRPSLVLVTLHLREVNILRKKQTEVYLVRSVYQLVCSKHQEMTVINSVSWQNLKYRPAKQFTFKISCSLIIRMLKTLGYME